MFKRLIASLACLTFSFSNLQQSQAQDFSINQLPVPGTMVGISTPFAPLVLKGLVVNPQKPLEFQFIVDTGRGPQDTASVKDQANQLVKYFLTGLTIPEGDLWVNLSPYEKNRMVSEALGQTELGRDLLAQDYILKQLTASLIYPEKDLGKEFWSRVYAKAQEQFGSTNVPVNTFNKVWILPNEAQVFENGNAAYVTKSTLKVMLDEDYLAKQKHQATQASSISSQIVRQIILPEIEKEVNTGKNFSPLRQIYQALILAKWYKETIQNGLLDAVYTNKKKTGGVNLTDPAVKEEIYDRYLQAYKKGVFNYIKEDSTPDGQEVPRKYFSGGISKIEPEHVDTDGAMSAVKSNGAMLSLTVTIKTAGATIVKRVGLYRGLIGLNWQLILAGRAINKPRKNVIPVAQDYVEFLAGQTLEQWKAGIDGNQHGIIDDKSFDENDAKAGIMPIIHAVGSPAPQSFYNAAKFWKKYMQILKDTGIRNKEGETPTVPVVITNGRGRGYKRLVINTFKFIDELKDKFGRSSDETKRIEVIVKDFETKFQVSLAALKLEYPFEDDDTASWNRISRAYNVAGPDNLNESQVIKLLFRLGSKEITDAEAAGKTVFYMEQQSDSTFANMTKGYPVLRDAVDNTYGIDAKIKIHIIADAFHRMRSILQAKKDLIEKNHLEGKWLINGNIAYIPDFNKMDDQQLYAYLKQMIGAPDQADPPFGEIGRIITTLYGPELEKRISFPAARGALFNTEYNHWKNGGAESLRTQLFRQYRDALDTKNKYEVLIALSKIRNSGHEFTPQLDFKQGTPLTLWDIERIRNNSGNPPRTADEVKTLLKQAKDENRDLTIVGHLRGADIAGSSLDLPEFQKKLTEKGTTAVDHLPSTIAIASDFETKIKFELDENNPDAITYVAPAYGITGMTKTGDIDLNAVPDKDRQKYAPFFILSNIFGLKGIKVTLADIPPMAMAGGMESSNVFNVALIAAGSMLSGANLSQAEIFSLAVKLENDEFKGLTGGQGHGATLTGGIYQQVWTSEVKTQFGTLINPYSFTAVPLMNDEVKRKLEESTMLVQAGKEYLSGKAVTNRAASLTNNMWTDLLRDEDEVGLPLHKEKLNLAASTTKAIQQNNPDMIEVIANNLQRHAEIRDELCKRWLNLMMDARNAQLGLRSKDGIPKYAFKYADKVFEPSNGNFAEYELLRDVFTTLGEPALRNYRIYSLDPIATLQDAGKKEGITIFPLGAGGPGANLIAVDPQGKEHLENFLKLQGLNRINNTQAGQIINAPGTNILKGFMDFKIGKEPMSFGDFGTLQLEREKIKVPQLPDFAMLDQKSSDKAMFQTPNVISKNSQDLGGIDLNQININRTGKIINVQFDPAQLDELIQSGFKGFTPVIINITPISSPLPLLGVNPAKEPEILAKA